MTDKANDELREAIYEILGKTEYRLHLVQKLLYIYKDLYGSYREDTCNDDGNEDHYDTCDEEKETIGRDLGEEICRLKDYINGAPELVKELQSIANNELIDENEIYETITQLDYLYPDDAVYEELLSKQ